MDKFLFTLALEVCMGDHFWQHNMVHPWRTIIIKGGPFLSTNLVQGGPYLAA